MSGWEGSGRGGRLLPLSGAVLGEHRAEERRDDLLFRLGEPGDGVELLFEPGDRATPGASRGGGCVIVRAVVADQRLDRDAEGAAEPGQHRHRHAPLADLVESELGLGDTEPVGELGLRQIGVAAGVGDALAQRVEIGLFVGTHGGQRDPVWRAVHERNPGSGE